MTQSPPQPSAQLPAQYPVYGTAPAMPSACPQSTGDHGARQTTILLVAKIIRATGDDLCRIRNLSPDGMSIETMSSLRMGEPVSIEMKNGAAVDGEVTWTTGTKAGLRFDSPIDVADLLAIGARTPRLLRFAARCPVALRRDGYLLRGTLVDISQGGAKIQLAEPGRVGDTGTLAVPGLESQRAVIQWVRDGAAGLAFATSLRSTALSQWLSGDQRFSAAETAPINPIHQNS